MWYYAALIVFVLLDNSLCMTTLYTSLNPRHSLTNTAHLSTVITTLGAGKTANTTSGARHFTTIHGQIGDVTFSSSTLRTNSILSLGQTPPVTEHGSEVIHSLSTLQNTAMPSLEQTTPVIQQGDDVTDLSLSKQTVTIPFLEQTPPFTETYHEVFPTTIPIEYQTETRPVTTNMNHPVEAGWVPRFADNPQLIEEDAKDDDVFVVIDGKLLRVSHNQAVYGDIRYVHASGRVVVPVTLTSLLVVTCVFSYLIIQSYGRDSEMGKCSKMLLICIAVCDVGTITCSLAENVFLYDRKSRNFDTLPFDSCKTMLVLERLSSVPHTISLWLTVVLSSQRFVCVCKPFRAKNTITLRKTAVIIWVVVVVSVTFHLPRFLDTGFRYVAIMKDAYPGQVIKTCDSVYKHWVTDTRLYEGIYLWTRFILVKFVPILALTITAVAMVRILTRKLDIHKDLRKLDTKSSANKLSVYIVIVSIIVVVAEFPIGVLSCIYAVSISISQTIIPYNTFRRVSTMADIVLHVSYCVVFLTYCLMTKKFRAYVSHCVSSGTKDINNTQPEDRKAAPDGMCIELGRSTVINHTKTSSSQTLSKDTSTISTVHL